MSERRRSPRLEAHLATRERPGEVVVALWFLGFFLFQGVMGTLMLLSDAGASPLALLYGLYPAWMGACFFGLWNGTRWGWGLSVATLGLVTVLCLVVLAVVVTEGRDDMTFSNSLFGMTVISGFVLIAGAPLLLLVKARRRYQAWAERERNRRQGNP